MTFLELVNSVRENSGASGPPLTTLGGVLSYQNTRIKNWVNEAWGDIQSEHRTWDFMERDFSIQTAIGTQGYASSDAAVTLATPGSFANWKRDTFRTYKTALGFSDEQLLGFLAWPDFRNLYQYATMRTTQQRPVLFSIDFLKKLQLGPVPDDVYTVLGQYYKAPSDLVADTDVPLVDEEFHMLIVYGAMKKYGYFEAAPEVLARGKDEYGPLMARLESDYLPSIVSGPTLA